jgi:hypothetical protein
MPPASFKCKAPWPLHHIRRRASRMGSQKTYFICDLVCSPFLYLAQQQIINSRFSLTIYTRVFKLIMVWKINNEKPCNSMCQKKIWGVEKTEKFFSFFKSRKTRHSWRHSISMSCYCLSSRYCHNHVMSTVSNVMTIRVDCSLQTFWISDSRILGEQRKRILVILNYLSIQTDLFSVLESIKWYM